MRPSFRMDAVEIVSSAVLGIECEAVFVGGKVYHLRPPTIRRLAGAAMHLRGGEGDTIKDVVLSMDLEGQAHALSWLVEGNDSLFETFMDCRVDEVQEGIIRGLGMVDPRNFTTLSALQRNVRSLIARPRS